jgi:tetratricopeptide (TPR) repeat protein
LALFGQTHPEYFQMALLAKNQIDYQGACKMLSKAIEIAPNEEKYYLERGEIYLGLEKYDKALDDFNAALRIDSMDVDPWIGRSMYYLYLQEPDSALREASIAHILADHKYTRAKASSALGEIYHSMGEDSTALAYFSESLILDTTNTKGYKKAALICLENENYKTAENYLRKAHANDPGDMEILINLAYVYNQLTYYRQAVEYCNLALAFDPNHPLALNNRAVAYFNLDEQERALDDIDDSIRQDKSNPLSYRYKAEILLALNERYRKVCKCLEKAKRLGYTALYDFEVDHLIAEHCGS